jgi:hypothetical protein
VTIVPSAPVAQQSRGFAQEAALSAFVVAVVWALQLEPSLVVSSVPLSPTAQQVVVAGAHATAHSTCEVPEVCVTQLAPPLVVERTVP